MGVWIVVALVVLLLLGEPLFVVLGGVTVLCFMLLTGEVHQIFDLAVMVEKIVDLGEKEVLLAIPFFVVAGAIMSRGKIGTQLTDLAKAIVGWLPGGMAVATVISCALFASISGSSPATVIAIGSVMLPALIQDRYRENFSLGLVTTAGSLGILIPPSIPMIIYSVVKTRGEKIEVGDLFLAGIGPGLLISGLLIAYSAASGIRFGVARQKFSWGHVKDSLLSGYWAVLLPVIILGGIYTGFMTATEASAVAVVYAFIVEAFIHQELDAKGLKEVLSESALLLGALLMILVMALAFNEYLTDQKIPEQLAAWIRAKQLTPVGFLLLVNGLLLLAGGVMEILSAIMILVPLLAPVAEGLGIHPLHLAIVFIVNLELGYMTPPIGINLFVTASLFGKPVGKVIKAVLPTLTIMAIAVLAVTFIPTIQMGIVNWVHDRPFYQPFPSGGPAAPKKPTKAKSVADDNDTKTKKKKKTGGKSLADLTDEADDDLDDDDEKPKKPGKVKPKSLADLTDEADEDLEDEDENEGNKADAGNDAKPGKAPPGKAPPDKAPPANAPPAKAPPGKAPPAKAPPAKAPGSKAKPGKANPALKQLLDDVRDEAEK